MCLAKVFPSLSCAVPVLYAGVGETAELLEAHKCGVVVAPEEPALLAQAIAGLVADPSRRRALGWAGRAFVEREYSWATLVGCWLAELGHFGKEKIPVSKDLVPQAETSLGSGPLDRPKNREG